MTRISFKGNLAGLNTAARPISFGNDGDAKIVIETSATEQLAVVSLLALAKEPLIFTVEIDEEAIAARPQG